MSKEPSVRAFIALELKEPLRASLEKLQQRLHANLGGIRLVRPEAIHLTLRFLGPTRQDQLQALDAPLAAAARACPALEARIGGIGTFPERGRPHVLWVGVELEPAALELQRACEQAARDAGFAPEERPFRAHLTLGRWRDHATRPELPETDLGPTCLDSLVLFRSEQAKDGMVYTSLARFPLASA